MLRWLAYRCTKSATHQVEATGSQWSPLTSVDQEIVWHSTPSKLIFA